MKIPIKPFLVFIFTIFIGVVGFGIWKLLIRSQSQQAAFEQNSKSLESTTDSSSDKAETEQIVSDSIAILPCSNSDFSKHLLSYKNKAIAMEVVNVRVLCGNLPQYPTNLRNKKIAGTVIVSLHINEMGEVSEIFSSSGHPLLRRLAEKAAYQTRFTPMMLNGEARRIFGTLVYQFDSERGVWLINPLSPKYPYLTV